MISEEILENMIDNYANDIFKICFLYLKDYHLVEDALQETFIKAAKSYDRFQGKSSQKTWLVRT